jgi:phosphoadenosine phosphosulfate reductase
MEARIKEWNERFAKAPVEEVLGFFNQEFGTAICLSSSMGAEDQVLTHILSSVNPNFRIFTLDTGRLFPETLNLIQLTRDHYQVDIEVFFPDYKLVQAMVREKGINLFYNSVENRKLCCQIRKMEPLKRALAGMKAWVTGIRKDQTLNRFNTNVVEWDETNEIVKINPLYRWSEKMVWDYIKQYQIPYNELHDKGFPSIGCQPCTRAIEKGEDSRAGRWWWEDQGHRECGLHVKDSSDSERK